MHSEDAYERTCRTLHKHGIKSPRTQVLFCPVEYTPSSGLIYRVPVTIGSITKYDQRPIRRARQRRDLLIGFVYADGTLRTDAEVLCGPLGQIDIPDYVCFWLANIPPNERLFLAGGEARLREKPIIVVSR